MIENESEIRQGAIGITQSKDRADRQNLLHKSTHSNAPSSEVEATLTFLDPELIASNPQQPRLRFDAEQLQELAASIRQDGILQPLIVMKHAHSPGRYTLIAGERRLRAAKMAGLTRVPVLMKETSGSDRLRLALIENIQRADLNIIEEGKAYEALIHEYGLTQEQCGEKVGKERSSISNTLRLLALPEPVQQDLIAGRLTGGHARALLSLEDPANILKARDFVIQKELSVRKTELLCKKLKDAANAELELDADKPVDADLEYIADSLRNFFRTKVTLSGVPQRGKIEISYFSTAELERIIGLITKSM